MKSAAESAEPALIEAYLEPSTPAPPRLLDEALQHAAQAAEMPPVPRRARVLEALSGRRVRVGLDALTLEATLALAGPYAPACGDVVLVLPSPDGAFVVGLVEAKRDDEPPPEASAAPARSAEAHTSDGASASVERDVLTVRAPGGEVLFTHDAKTGRSEVRSREVHLRADELHLEGRAVSIRAEEELSIARGADSLQFDARGVELEAGRFGAKLTAARFAMKEVVFGAERLESAVKRARQVVDVAELRAGRLVQRARTVFRETEEVEQVRAGRIRMVAKAAFQVLAERATVTAEQDITLMGDKIHLA